MPDFCPALPAAATPDKMPASGDRMTVVTIGVERFD